MNEMSEEEYQYYYGEQASSGRQTSPRQSPNSAGNRKAYAQGGGLASCFSLVFWIMVIGAITIACAYNLQPWIVIGRDIAGHIDVFPGLGLLGRAFVLFKGQKLLGFVALGYGIFKFTVEADHPGQRLLGFWLGVVGLVLLGAQTKILENLGIITGVILWGWCQWVQVLPILAELIPGLSSLKKELRRYRTVSYLLEALIMTLRFPPYAGGEWAVLWADLSANALDPTQVNWFNFARAGGAMLIVEFTVIFLIKMAMALGVAGTTRARRV